MPDVDEAWTGRRDTDELEITPAMIGAGIGVLCKYETETAGESYWAREVFTAMARAAPSSFWARHTSRQ